ncbi:D-alanyl-D-alanine carboxypeptidase [Streptomyces oryzae]|uniref:D-alanyl-D-alanine carboxypeptidase n=1 Tax=Streptomyces oryzae TaxID=1434886 RepID=A0ABS3XHL9_9ACTN|nr:D-alanyl-D-alanine carboxypeptidase [Streptomyces oryzae]
MAGESPDRSERERSSGETTGSGGTVARPDETAEKKRSESSGSDSGQNGTGTTTQDAKPSKIPAPTSPAAEPQGPEGAAEADGDRTAQNEPDRPGRPAQDAQGRPAPDKDADGSEGREQGRDGDDGDDGDGDARLKSAVAAWVSGDDAPAGSEAPKGDSEGKSAGQNAAEDGSAAPSTDLPVRPKPTETGGAGTETGGAGSGEGAGPAPQSDTATAMFGVLRRDGDRSGKDDDATAADRAEQLTSAFFGAPKGAKSADEAGKSDSGSAGSSDGKPSVDQPTAVFRTLDDKRGEGASGGSTDKGEKSAEGEKPEKHEGPEKSSRKGSATPTGAPDPRTSAMSGAPDPRKRDGRDDRDHHDGRDNQDKRGNQGGQGTAEDRQGSGTGTGTGSGRDQGSGEESDAERTSQFIPLRSADEPRTPAKSAPPAAAATATATPAAPGKPASPGKPDAAPAAPTANPWSSAPPRPAGAPAGPGTVDPSEAPGAAESEPERTRQQPMPGSPEAEGGGQQPQPLDLLAQLTNSPPPPATPLRTFTRRVKIWTPLVLLLAVVFVVVQAVRPLPDPELSMTAAGTYTFDGSKPSMPWPSEGQAVIDVDGLGSFGSYGKQKPVPIASVAKVMTAYVILRDHPVKKGTEGKKIPVDQKAEDEAGLSAQNESTVKVKAGEKITQKEALNAIMIASANNVARLLARWDAGSEKAFVKKMNAAAKDLGMTNSHYTDPSGLTASTVSTAADQVKLGKKVMESALFRQVVRQPSYVDTNGKTQPNWNRLVPMDGVVGIKTGTTTKAGGNLLFAAEKEIGGTKQLIIGAVLGQYQPSILDTVLAASKKLIDAGQDALTAKKVVKKGQVVGYVDDQLGGKTPVVATKDVTAVGWPGLKVKLGLTDNGKAVPHTAGPGTKVGTLTVGAGPGQVKVPVALQDELTEPGFGDKLTRVG